MARIGKHDHEHGSKGKGEPAPPAQESEREDREAQDRLLECIEECLNCHVACTTTVQHCLASGGELADVNLVGVLLDCVDLTQVTANLILRGSPYHPLACGVCAELCRSGEEACRAAAHEDDQLEHCAEVCATCAELCEAILALADEDEEDE